MATKTNKMAKLFCVLLGVAGSVFCVNIDLTETVDDLKEKIKEKNPEIDCSTWRMTVYRAKLDNGSWLKVGSDDFKAVERGEISGAIQAIIENPMEPIECLADDSLFGPNFKREARDIHVLVALPADYHEDQNKKRKALDPDSVGDILEARLTKIFHDRDEKSTEYSLSDLNSKTNARLLTAMHLIESMPLIDEKEPSNACSTPAFVWNKDQKEDHPKQRERYMEYLQTHLAPRMKRNPFVLEDVYCDEQVLSCRDPRLPFAVNGTADVLLLNRPSKDPLGVLAGVSVVIELKKKVENSDLPQAIGQLISCSMKAPRECYPLGLLTDLNDKWHFLWISDKHTLTRFTLKYPANAFDFLVDFVTKNRGPTLFELKLLPGKKFQNLRVDDIVPHLGNAQADEELERYELMADVLEPEFLMARRMEYVQQLVHSMPAYAHMYT